VSTVSNLLTQESERVNLVKDGFDWDEGNRDKNLRLHGVTDNEAEQIFYNSPKVHRKSNRLLAYG